GNRRQENRSGCGSNTAPRRPRSGRIGTFSRRRFAKTSSIGCIRQTARLFVFREEAFAAQRSGSACFRVWHERPLKGIAGRSCWEKLILFQPSPVEAISGHGFRRGPHV